MHTTDAREPPGNGPVRPPHTRLDLRAKLRQVSLDGHLREYVATGTLSSPVVVELDPTTLCDLACPECISGELLGRGGFSRKRLVELAEEIAESGVWAVILIGGGEPLLHPAVGDVISALARAGVHVGLTTNGTQLHRYMDQIAESVAWTRVSVDAGTAETYARFRPAKGKRNPFDSVVANLRALGAAKRGAMGYSYLLMSRHDPVTGALVDSNFREVHQAAVLAKEVGCDYFEVKPAYDMQHYLLSQQPELIDDLTAQMRECELLETDAFAVIHPANLVEVMTGAPMEQPKQYDACPVTEFRTLLTPTAAYACPYHRGNAKAQYGDPSAQSFRQLWSSEARREIAATLRPSEDCRFHCIRHESNLDLLALAKHGAIDGFATREDYDRFI
jgi:hypothetical protein